jgi:hypothetical protein
MFAETVTVHVACPATATASGSSRREKVHDVPTFSAATLAQELDAILIGAGQGDRTSGPEANADTLVTVNVDVALTAPGFAVPRLGFRS